MSKQHEFINKPAILQVLPALMSGGVERTVLDVSEQIVAAGMKSFIASSGGRLVSQVYQHGGRHIELPLHSKNPITIIRNIFKLRDIIKLHDIKIIHAQSRAPAWSAYFAAKLAKCHFVTTIHGAHGTKGYFKKIYNSVMTKGEKVIVVSEFIADYAKINYEFDHSKLIVIHGGVNVDKFNYKRIEEKRMTELAKNLHIPTDKPIILLPGRLTRIKGHFFLLEAIKLLAKDSVTCLFVGDDAGHLKYREELQDKIKEYHLEDRVIITSNVSDMPAIYALSDVVTCVSIRPEAFGLVSVEAQSMGRMVVISDSGGLRETVVPDKTGWLIEPNNVNSLVDAIKKILEMDLSTRLYHANLAREYVEKNFSLASVGKKIIKTYEYFLLNRGDG